MQVKLNSGEHKLLLNSNSSLLLDLKDKKIAVVGSSGILLDKEYGKEIDDHDYIVRFMPLLERQTRKDLRKMTLILFLI